MVNAMVNLLHHFDHSLIKVTHPTSLAKIGFAPTGAEHY